MRLATGIIVLGLVAALVAPNAAACAELWATARGTATDTLTGDVWQARIHRSWGNGVTDRVTLYLVEPELGVEIGLGPIEGRWSRSEVAFTNEPWCASVERQHFRTQDQATSGSLMVLDGVMGHCFAQVLDGGPDIRGHLVGRYLHFDLDVWVPYAWPAVD